MHLEAKETARLYKLLTEKLGNDTTDAMFNYIDNKTEQAVEATIKTLATKDDISNLRKEMVIDVAGLRKDLGNGIANVRNEISNLRYDLRKDISESKADNIKWMFIFWIGSVGVMLSIALLILKK
jgi:hypothetical protein